MRRARAAALWSASALTVDLSASNPVPRLLLLIVALNVLLACRRPGASLRPLLLAAALATVSATAVSVLLGHSGAHVLARLPAGLPLIGGPITLEHALFGLDSGLGIAAALLAVAPLVLVIEPSDLADALPRSLRRTGAALTAALLLVPAMLRSATAVHEAQLSRGGTARSWRHLGDLAVPVVVGAVESSVHLAEAMEVRGHGAHPAIRYEETASSAELSVAVTAGAALVLAVVATATGAIADWPLFPQPQWPTAGAATIIPALLLLTPLMAWPSSSSTA
jgi:energy-coupling factor transport system permease protein